jgi:hypothetical protein
MTEFTGNCIWIGRKGKVGSEIPHIFISMKMKTDPERAHIRSWPLSKLRMNETLSLDGVRDKDRIEMLPAANPLPGELGAEITKGSELLYFFLYVVKVCKEKIEHHADNLLQTMEFWHRVPNEVAYQLREKGGPV